MLICFLALHIAHSWQWLNNCVGRKNYLTFISLMASSLIWVCFEANISLLMVYSLNNFLMFFTCLLVKLFIEAGVGIAVFVRYFVNRKGMETAIIDRLGNGFTPVPYPTVVVCWTNFVDLHFLLKLQKKFADVKFF